MRTSRLECSGSGVTRDPAVGTTGQARAAKAKLAPPPHRLSIAKAQLDRYTDEMTGKPYDPRYTVGDLVRCRHWPASYLGIVREFVRIGDHDCARVQFPRHAPIFAVDQFLRADR